MKFIASFCLVGTGLLSFHATALPERDGNIQSVERQLPAGGNFTTTSFPRMYTAVVPCPDTKESSSDMNAIHFAAEVDLIGIVAYGLPSPYDGTGSAFCKISFLVHNALELKNIEALNASPTTGLRSSSAGKKQFSIASSMEQDLVETKRMVDSARGNHDNIKGNRRLVQYATINGYTCFRSLAGMAAWMVDIEKKGKTIPNLSIKINVIGKSYKGYNMTALVLTGNGVAAASRTTVKGPMFVMAGIHAREYAPPELLARWVEFLVSGYGTDADITSILDHTVIHLVFEANPDGRAIAETNRGVYQRKSAHDYGNCGSSGGVDLNRNFPFMWGRNDGSSGYPCAETYRGPSAASEPEVQAIVNYAKTIFPINQRKSNPESQLGVAYPDSAIGVFIDFHSYGETMIWPWGFQNVLSPNEVGFGALVNKYKSFNGYAYSGPNNGFSYPASGASDDWAYGTLGAAAMTFELGTDFYQPCTYFSSSIVPKSIGALNYAAKIAGAPYSLPKGPDVIKILFDAASVNSTGVLKVRPTASDSAWSPGKFATSTQGVASIRAWVDVHPYDSGAGTGEVVSGVSLTSDPTTGLYAIQASRYRIGNHTIYFEATDKSGFKGPISAAKFVITTK